MSSSGWKFRALAGNAATNANGLQISHGTTERIHITSNGKVGIGTDNPTARLQVYRATTFADNPIIQARSNHGSTNELKFEIDGDGDAYFSGNIGIGTDAPENDIHLKTGSATMKLTSTDAATSTRLILESESDSYGGIHFGDPSDEDAGRIRYYHGGSNPNHMQFITNASEAMRITNTGRLLIGGHTTAHNTGYKIDIQADNTNHAHGVSVRSLTLQNDSLCVAALAHATPSGASTNRRAYIGVYRNGSSQPGGFVYMHQQDGGNTYIWPDSSNVLRISNAIGNVTNDAGTVVGSQTSDIRLKNVFGNVTYGLAEINKINPIQFNFKNDKNAKKRIGFSAQDLQSIIPESVYNTKNTEEVDGVEIEDVLGMEYAQITPVLVNAVKELSTEIDKLKAEITALKSS